MYNRFDKAKSSSSLYQWEDNAKLKEWLQLKIFTVSVYAKQFPKNFFQKAFLGDRDSLLEFQKR